MKTIIALFLSFCCSFAQAQSAVSHSRLYSDDSCERTAVETAEQETGAKVTFSELSALTNYNGTLYTYTVRAGSEYYEVLVEKIFVAEVYHDVCKVKEFRESRWY